MLSSRILVEGNYKLETIGQPKLNVCNNSNLQNTVFSYIVTYGIKGCVKVHFLSTLEQFGMLIRNIWLVSNELQQWQSKTKTAKLRLEVSRKFLYPPSPFLPKKSKGLPYHPQPLNSWPMIRQDFDLYFQTSLGQDGTKYQMRRCRRWRCWCILD